MGSPTRKTDDCFVGLDEGMPLSVKHRLGRPVEKNGRWVRGDATPRTKNETT